MKRKAGTRPPRLYCDTAVFGGCFDDEFAFDSRRVVRMARQGNIRILVSEAVLNELASAPERVRGAFDSVPKEFLEVVQTTDDVKRLQLAYFDAGILTQRWALDAFHVAAATCAGADALVSWNFRHLVRYDKMKAFNAVNQSLGYGAIVIVSPKEVPTHVG